jgi:hypothetical protein
MIGGGAYSRRYIAMIHQVEDGERRLSDHNLEELLPS